MGEYKPRLSKAPTTQARTSNEPSSCSKADRNHIYGGCIITESNTGTRNKRGTSPPWHGSNWGRTLDLPEYETRAYLSRCAVRHPCCIRRIAFSYSDCGMGNLWRVRHVISAILQHVRSVLFEYPNAVLQCWSFRRSSSCNAG